ncbi:MAG: hypothetical protein E7812_17425 [Phenylobacterium sp.]|nr:MAG: hypothetical protein E7812_17425 [Phenylobacterium sp.]
MSRSVVTYAPRALGAPVLARKAGEPTPPPEDHYKDRLLKYVPAEVVTLYLTLAALLTTAPKAPSWLGWAIFAVGVAATWFYLSIVLHVKDWRQLLISTLSFVVWVFALGGPFKQFDWYMPIYGGLLLPAFTFFVARFKTAPVDA